MIDVNLCSAAHNSPWIPWSACRTTVKKKLVTPGAHHVCACSVSGQKTSQRNPGITSRGLPCLRLGGGTVPPPCPPPRLGVASNECRRSRLGAYSYAIITLGTSPEESSLPPQVGLSSRFALVSFLSSLVNLFGGYPPSSEPGRHRSRPCSRQLAGVALPRVTPASPLVSRGFSFWRLFFADPP